MSVQIIAIIVGALVTIVVGYFGVAANQGLPPFSPSPTPSPPATVTRSEPTATPTPKATVMLTPTLKPEPATAVAPVPPTLCARTPTRSAAERGIRPSTLPPTKLPDWEVKVEPPIARHYVGSEHKVNVTVRDLNGVLIIGETVHLQIVDGPHIGLVLEIQTNENGEGVFCYTGDTKGRDIIHVWAGDDQYDALPEGMKAQITHDWI